MKNIQKSVGERAIYFNSSLFGISLRIELVSITNIYGVRD
jgi:hypothetical protein